MEFTRSRSKNRSFKNWLSLCFKPVTVDDPFEPISQKAKADAVLSTYFGVCDGEGGGGVLPLPTILSSALTTVAECQEGSIRRGRRKKGDDSCLWQVIKKALNETSLAKKMKKRKAAKDQFSRSSSIKSDQKAYRNSKEARRTHGTDLSASSSFRCSSEHTQSSLSSSTSSSSPSTNAIFGLAIKKPEDVKDNRKKHAGSNKALCLLLISLLVLIVWGKFYAIVCTSTLFSLMPRRSRRRCYQPGGGEEAELNSVEYKKRIIMGGLLERSRSRTFVHGF